MLKSVFVTATHYPAVLTLKVKNDQRSIFSNLSNWKEEA